MASKCLREKEVAGFHAVVLEAGSADSLVNWLKGNGFAFSPEVSAWANPYVKAHWKFTALRLAKPHDEHADKNVVASTLRISFQTDRPLFPYREPESSTAAKALGVKDRLLRIYFLGDSRYRGELTKDTPWTGTVAWADKLAPEDRQKILELLKIPADTGSAEWWLTEFEDHWPYRLAPADLYFSRVATQDTVKRLASHRVHNVSSRPDDLRDYGRHDLDVFCVVIAGKLADHRGIKGHRKRGRKGSRLNSSVTDSIAGAVAL